MRLSSLLGLGSLLLSACSFSAQAGAPGASSPSQTAVPPPPAPAAAAGPTATPTPAHTAAPAPAAVEPSVQRKTSEPATPATKKEQAYQLKQPDAPPPAPAAEENLPPAEGKKPRAGAKPTPEPRAP